MWTCSYCCDVAKGKLTRKAANRAIIRDRTRCMMRKIKNRIRHPFGMKITEEDEIPF